MFGWLKDLFKQEDDDIHIEDYIVKCPKCGSTNIGYFTGMINFVETMNGGTPHYKQTATCLNCKYKVESNIDDMSNNYLKQLELVRNDSKADN